MPTYRNCEYRDGEIRGERMYTKAMCEFRSRPDLQFISMAWYGGCSFEEEADGFGIGVGTRGDWSAIRDSSPEASDKMLTKALNFIETKMKKSS